MINLGIPKIKIMEKKQVFDLEDCCCSTIPLGDFIFNVQQKQREILENSPAGCDLILENDYGTLSVFSITERMETEKEYGKRVGKEMAKYKEYLKLKERFDPKE